ncbi:putative TNF receptor-associated factor 3 [Paratrimastix pyriformis]|uniref:TNF receptor-associated factor 3 n=1 Tax=Paratrimastix pyriformis TaxID=342808 RepID=A0ABQ8UDA5_9EUKA|nr:putative TNF receptor-associated factor 3 [Paratrimastix pyriformis]
MLCPICHCVMRQAVTLMCRGSHKACETCCQQWMERKPTCPCCQQELAKPHFNRDPLFNSFIQQLPVHCPKRPSCEWQGKLEDLTRHQTQECGQREVGCTHGGCTHRCPACALPGHLEGCQWKPVPCEKCAKVMPRKDIQGHLGTVCPAVEVPCPDCHQLFQRSTLDAHRAQCPEAPLPCPVQGCDAKVARCRLEEHIATAAPQHVTCLSRALQRTQAAMDECRAAQQRLQDEVAALRKQQAEQKAAMTDESRAAERLQDEVAALREQVDTLTVRCDPTHRIIFTVSPSTASWYHLDGRMPPTQPRPPIRPHATPFVGGECEKPSFVINAEASTALLYPWSNENKVIGLCDSSWFESSCLGIDGMVAARDPQRSPTGPEVSVADHTGR